MAGNPLSYRKVVDRVFLGVVIVLSLLSVVPLLLVFGHIIKEGWEAIRPSFFVNLPKPVGEAGGGIANALVGTIMLVVLASVFALPPGIAVGIYLAEMAHGKLATVARLCVEILQGIPSIVIGIVAYLWVVRPMGGFSAFSGAIALALMMLPVVVRTTEETLLLVPSSLKEASLAVGAPYYLTVLKVVLPAALSGIVTGALISIARIAGETAPLLFTAFGSPYMNWNAMKPVASLPHIIFNYAISPYEEWHKLAWGASLVLIALVLCLNVLSKVIARRWRVEF
ncbi:MAG: phosphate ABC transporter permease PstA [Chitinivibrionales bacterium]|nr:phosphate ABC transporter permease PstA [Chitinivibrionales bacterium]